MGVRIRYKNEKARALAKKAEEVKKAMNINARKNL